MRRIYENPEKTSENRLPQRAYYIPQGKSEYRLLNGSWRFANFARDIVFPKNITHWDTMLEGIDSVDFYLIHYDEIKAGVCIREYIPKNDKEIYFLLS